MTKYFTKILHLMSDLIDEGLKERSMGKHANVDVLVNSKDLFEAGTDTTSNTLEWAMAELLKNPHTLEKAQEELAQVIGRGKLINAADVANLRYLRCIVKENFRIHPQVPFLIPRKTEEDIDFCGYIIPKYSGTLVYGKTLWTSSRRGFWSQK
ncbi:hypothetical protein RDI58_004506 [Solanum bulbocastanum]|uniref:Cytochrome P450 n=1 Tax=Solanum bulbocastanum TaxID=147425 RepID=A0AAN8TZ69_SOLBU